MKLEPPLLKARRTDGTLHLGVRGAWVVNEARAMEHQVQVALGASELPPNIVIHGDELSRLDTSGAWLLDKACRSLSQSGREPELTGFDAEHVKLMEAIRRLPKERPPAPAKRSAPIKAIEGLGVGTVKGLRHLGEAIGFFGRLATTLFRALAHPTRLRLPSIVRHIYETGVTAIPIVALLSFLIALVLAYQGASQLGRFGAEIFTVDLTAISILREMGVLLTAILVAGRSGSAFAAEIGVMKLREEIDALRVMGVDPVELLVLPRVIGLVVALPLLTLIADLVGLLGGAIAIYALIDLSPVQYLERVHRAIETSTFWVGLVKAPVFAFIIATVGTFWGTQATGSAESVGRLTTVAVVHSIFLVILADAVFSILFSKLGV